MGRIGQLLVGLIAVGLLMWVPQAALAQTQTTTAPPSPTITQQDAVNQAQNQIAAPPTVFDITDPGIVYGQLREGVDAWIASLKGPTDTWGNQTSDVYVTAVRPDVVPASLQAYLLTHYKDHPTIGLAIGPEGVDSAVTQLQDDYNTNVSNLANNIYNTAVQEAINNAEQENQNQANNSENIPPLDNNDNGNENDNNSNNEDPPAGAPRISSISPTTITLAAGTKTIDINGENFGTDAEVVKVNFTNGTKDLQPSSVSDTAMSVTLPDDFIAGKDITVTVTVGEETSAGVNISAQPTISQILPQAVIEEDTINISGFGFDHVQDAGNVLTFTGPTTVERRPATCSFSPAKQCTEMTLRTSANDLGGEGSYTVSVTVNGQESNTASVSFSNSTT